MSAPRHLRTKKSPGAGCNVHLVACLILMIFLVSFGISENTVGARHSAHSLAEIPTHAPASTDVGASQVNVNLVHNSEPAPMGIADYGIGPNGAYSYSTSSFLGVVHLNSLSTQNSTGGRDVSIQLNVVLRFTSQSGTSYDYWFQNVAIYSTSSKGVYFEDNVWNMSSPAPKISQFGISGNGQVYTLNRESYYAAAANTSLPGNNIVLSLPTMIEFEVNSTINSQGEAEVALSYNDGFGWQVYDTVTFPLVRNIATDDGFAVSGTSYNPLGTFYNAELIFGGVGNGWNTTNLESNAILQLEYYNGHNYQQVYNAYNFGSDTSEGIDNLIALKDTFPQNGSLGVVVTAGPGSLGRVYSQSEVSILNIQTSLSSGTLYLENKSSTPSSPVNAAEGYPFGGSDVNITVSPGSYTFYLYDTSGSLTAEGSVVLNAGEYLPLAVSGSYVSSLVALTLSYSTVGGSPPSAPKLSFVSNGQKSTVDLSSNATTYYVDSGSTWSVSNVISGSQGERWEAAQTTSGTASSAQTINFVYYQQYSVSLSFNVLGSGSGYSNPTVSYYQSGTIKNVTVGTASTLNIWADAGSPYYFSKLLEGSTPSIERWETFSENGTISSPTTIVQSYVHQYYLTFETADPSRGSVNPPSDWYNASSQITIIETNNTGWGAGGWIGSGQGSYTGSNSSQTITVVGPITEQSIFYPSLTISAGQGGSVKFAYGNTSGTVPPGRSYTIYVPGGTEVTLSAHASSFLSSFNAWSGNVTGRSSSISLAVNSPSSVQAAFSYDYITIGWLIIIPAAIILIVLAFLTTRKRTTYRMEV